MHARRTLLDRAMEESQDASSPLPCVWRPLKAKPGSVDGSNGGRRYEAGEKETLRVAPTGGGLFLP